LQHVFSDKVKVVSGDVIEGEGLVAVAQIAAGEAIWEPDHDARRRNTAEIAALPPDNRHCQMGQICSSNAWSQDPGRGTTPAAPTRS